MSTPPDALDALRSAAGMDSGAHILHDEGELSVAATCGPLGVYSPTSPRQSSSS